jgi:hypothetical protein
MNPSIVDFIPQKDYRGYTFSAFICISNGARPMKKPFIGFKKSFLLLLLFTLSFFNIVLSQRACVIKEEINHSAVMTDMETTAPLPNVIIIPVVVHILYNDPEQNISNSRVKSQIKVLNEDFRKKNNDAA